VAKKSAFYLNDFSWLHHISGLTGPALGNTPLKELLNGSIFVSVDHLRLQHACLLKAILLQNLLTVVPVHLYPPVVSWGKFSVTTGGNFSMTDVNTTIKPLYGAQEGAAVSYNPRKPGRPSHSYHTYLMAGLRQVVGVEVRAGNEHTARHAQPGLLKLLDELPLERKPRLVRGDNAFGNNAMMAALEERGQPYLFKLKLSKNVKRLIWRLFREDDWANAGQGWEGKQGDLALEGWNIKRRIVVLRRPLSGETLVAGEEHGQQLLAFVEADRKAGKAITGYEYAVLVTNTDYEILTLGQLYRDRADAENAFDELKNQWGWGGYTTHDLHRCQLAARSVALIYNWWSLFVRLANPQARREAITSRPWLMSSVGRKTETCRANDDHADRIACRFRQGAGSTDAGLSLASDVGDPRCGAVQPHDRLEPLLRPS
jgi:hypothetical protein